MLKSIFSMKMSHHLFVAIVAVVFVFAGKSQGNISAGLVESTEVEKIVADPKFQNHEEAMIMAGTDKDSLATKASIESIRELVLKFPVHVVSPLAVNTAIDGILAAVRLIHTVVVQANKAIDTASNLIKVQDFEGAIDAIQKGLISDRELVFIAGVMIHNSQGHALYLVGGLALSKLKETIISIQKAGSAVFEVIEVANEIATAGINAGGRAAAEALKAARNAMTTGSMSVYKNLNDAALYALEGLQCAVSKNVYEVDTVPGIVESLKTQISTDDYSALDAIARLNKGLESVLSVLTKKPAIDAANVMYQGLKSTIVESAAAISVARKALEEARKLASQDPEAAVAAVHKGFKPAQNQLFSASAYGYLGLAAAGKIAGEKTIEKLVPSVLEIEYGRVQAYEDLALAERIVVVGLQGGEAAIAQGIDSALQMCNAAGTALYQQFADGGDIGFEAFQEV